MRYLVELAVFVVVLVLGMAVFKNAFYAVVAAAIVTGPIEALWSEPKRPQ
ncbi:MAG: hypothetical protein R3C51_03600 [Parvularculaceae bacterium]